MRVVVGTYRKRAYIEAALTSLDAHVSGVTDIVFVDDSGDHDHQQWLRQYGTVVDSGKSGYNTAMKAVCAAAGGEFFFLEEDFTFLTDIDLQHMSDILAERPHLAQLALLRGPWFPIEHRHGGLIEALQAKGEKFTLIEGVLEHTATFTGNPAVWRAEVAASGWPDGKWSEDRKRDQLLAEGYRFGYLPNVRVHHEGVRSGFDY